MKKREVNFTIISSMVPCSIRKERVNIAIISISKNDSKAILTYGERYSERFRIFFNVDCESLYFSMIEELKSYVIYLNELIDKRGIRLALESLINRSTKSVNECLRLDKPQVSIECEYCPKAKYIKYCDPVNKIIVWEQKNEAHSIQR